MLFNLFLTIQAMNLHDSITKETRLAILIPTKPKIIKKTSGVEKCGTEQHFLSITELTTCTEMSFFKILKDQYKINSIEKIDKIKIDFFRDFQ